MNINFSQKILGIVLVVVILLVSLSIYYVNQYSANTVTVYAEKIEDKIIKDGIVTANQTPVIATEGGEALYLWEEGKIVPPYVKIASVFSGELDEPSKEKLKLLNDKIIYSEANKKVNKNLASDISSINRDIAKNINDIINRSDDRDYKEIYKIKNEIRDLNIKSIELKGGNPPKNYETNINEEIKKTERELNFKKKDYYSPTCGMFSARVSNFDELINPEKLLKINPTQFDEIMKNDFKIIKEVETGKSFCKIINNFEWYLGAKYSKKELENLEVGDTVGVRVINSSDDKVEGTVSYISEYKGNEAVMVVKSTKNIYNIWTAGKVEFELIKSTKTGIKVPISSIISKDGKKGVYAVKDGVYKFIEVRVLLSDKKFALIENKSINEPGSDNRIILYDSVVINPKSVREGSIAN